MKTIALIPARGGSKRIPGKNIRNFCGHPLIAWTIQQANISDCFDDIVVSTDCGETHKIAEKYGAHAIYRPDIISQDHSTDYEWVSHVLANRYSADIYCILRPTSPFRHVSTIVWGMELLQNYPCDSVRAIRRASEHPLKMWTYNKFIDGSGRITPLLPIVDQKTRPYDLPTQDFSMAYVQTGGLQVGWTKNVKDGDISGSNIMGIVQHWPENVDLNTEEDWEHAEWLVKSGKAKLPKIG